MTAVRRQRLDRADLVLVQLLQLAAEVILAYPALVPSALYELCDDWAADLAAALAPRLPEAAAPGRAGSHPGPGT